MQDQYNGPDLMAEFAEIIERTARFGRWTAWNGCPPNRPGCYALVDGNRCYYVGQTKSLEGRIKQHGWRPNGSGVDTRKWGFIPGAVIKTRCSRPGDYSHLKLEAALIDRLRPKYNIRNFAKVYEADGLPEPLAECPAYTPKEGEQLISLSALAAKWQMPITTVRKMVSANVVDAVPEGITEWVIQFWKDHPQ